MQRAAEHGTDCKGIMFAAYESSASSELEQQVQSMLSALLWSGEYEDEGLAHELSITVMRQLLNTSLWFLFCHFLFLFLFRSWPLCVCV